MRKLFLLLRIDALGVLGTARLSDPAARRKAVRALALGAFVAVCLLGTSLMYFYMMAGAFAALGTPELTLGIAAVAGALLVIALGWIFAQRFKKKQEGKPAVIINKDAK